MKQHTHKKSGSKEKRHQRLWKGWFFFSLICTFNVHLQVMEIIIEFSWDLSEILCWILFLIFFVSLIFHHQVIDYWIFRVKFAETEVRENIMAFTVAMVRISTNFSSSFNPIFNIRYGSKVVLDSLNVAFIAIEFIHAKPPVT